jgi:cholesterol oxidase
VGQVKRGTLEVFPAGQVGRRSVRTMHYEMRFELEGEPWTLQGWKFIEDDPGPDLWGDTTALFVQLSGPGQRYVGTMRLGMADFLNTMLPDMRVIGTRDPRRIAWTMARFLVFFGHGLQRVYLPVAVRHFIDDMMGELRHG